MTDPTMPIGTSAARPVTGTAESLFLSADRMAAGPGYIPSLDGIRAISILLVLFAHHISVSDPKLS